MKRREFSIAVQLAIVERARDEGERILCERCGVWVKSRKDWEIDHILAEGMRPYNDKARPLTAADGQLLCVAVCHKEKTAEDKANISRAKRVRARGLGLYKPGTIKFARLEKEMRKPLKVAPRTAGDRPEVQMTRLAMIAVLGLLGASSQAQACHRFSRWYFPWPQHCSPLLRSAPTRALAAVVAAPAPDASWYVEITKLPDDPEFEREYAIDQLKELLHKP